MTITLPARPPAKGSCRANPEVARDFELIPIDDNDEFTTIVVDVEGKPATTIEIPKGQVEWTITVK
jgi:hypothetical protein